MDAQPNITDEFDDTGEVIYPILEPVLTVPSIPEKDTSCFSSQAPNPDKGAEAIYVKKKIMENQQVQVNSTGHISAEIARNNFTYDVLSKFEGDLLAIGTNKFEGNNSVVMVSEQFGSKFKCPAHATSKGVYARLVPE